MKRKQRQRITRQDAGVTLLELMFAAGVMALALSMLFGSLIGINLMGEVAEGRTRAAAAMSSVMEELRTSSFDDILDFAPTPIDHPSATFGIQVDAVDDGDNLVTLPLGENATATFPNPTELQVTVVWTTPQGRVYSISSSTMKGR